mgnify:CR=1 FL=1
MSSSPSAELTTAVDALVAPRRRYLLSRLLECERERAPSERRSLEALATAVAAMEHGSEIVTDEQVDRVQLTLVHAHIPRLVDAGLVAQHDDGDATTLSLGDHPRLDADWVQSLLADPTAEAAPIDEATVNRTLEAFRSPRRRAVCAVLVRWRGTVSVDDLAAMVVARTGGDGMGLVDVTESACAAVATSLVHEHLPVLSAAGLVEYDAATRQVTRVTDAPQWQADWVADGPLAAVGDVLRQEHPRDEPADADSVPAETPVDVTVTTAPIGDETADDEASATEEQLFWTLARPPAGR